MTLSKASTTIENQTYGAGVTKKLFKKVSSMVKYNSIPVIPCVGENWEHFITHTMLPTLLSTLFIHI